MVKETRSDPIQIVNSSVGLRTVEWIIKIEKLRNIVFALALEIQEQEASFTYQILVRYVQYQNIAMEEKYK